MSEHTQPIIDQESARANVAMEGMTRDIDEAYGVGVERLSPAEQFARSQAWKQLCEQTSFEGLKRITIEDKSNDTYRLSDPCVVFPTEEFLLPRVFDS